MEDTTRSSTGLSGHPSGRLSRTGRSSTAMSFTETPDVTPRVGYDVRTTKDGSMMASLADRAYIQSSKTPEKWYRTSPSTDTLQVLAYVRHRLKTRSVILLDFLSDCDTIPGAGRPHRIMSGYIARTALRKALDKIGGFNDMSEAAFDRLADAFTEERSQAEFSERCINYEAMCEVLQGKSHHSLAYRQGSRELKDEYEMYRCQLDHERFNAAFFSAFDDMPFARQPLSESGERRFKAVKQKIMLKIYADRISARELLGDFDPHLNTSVSWMKKGTQRTPMINMSPGCISRSQFLRGMHGMVAGLGIGDDDIALIFNKYCKNGSFNYYAFCKDVDIPPTLKDGVMVKPGSFDE